MKEEILCKICGGKISATAKRHTGICKKCTLELRHAESEERRKKQIEAWDRKCLWCGGPIKYTHNKDVETCSRRCQMYLMQSRKKETKEHLESRLISYIKEQDHYVKLSELRKVFKLSDKLIYARGISCSELNYKAGKLAYLQEKNKTVNTIEREYAELLRSNPSLRMNDVAKIIHVSVKRMTKMGIKARDIREKFGIVSSTQSTKDEIEDRVVSWLKTQPCYVSAGPLCRALNIDFASSIQAKGLTIAELNMKAGHSRSATSYYEEYTACSLAKNNLVFERQKTFKDCRDVYPLRFDFWLPVYNTLIEVQGMQHYNKAYYNYDVMHMHDHMKKQYAAKNGLHLFCIDTAPAKTFEERLSALMDTIKGLDLVTDQVHTASNCEKLLPDNAEDNSQPSVKQTDLFG